MLGFATKTKALPLLFDYSGVVTERLGELSNSGKISVRVTAQDARYASAAPARIGHDLHGLQEIALRVTLDI